MKGLGIPRPFLYIYIKGGPMFEANNFFPLLLAIIPVILYCMLVYVFIPVKMICTKRAKRYLIYGLLSPLLVLLFHYMFPGWLLLSYLSSTPYFTLAVIQIALLEETLKFLMFKYVDTNRKNTSSDLPIATMYYTMMVSAGFALTENIYYLMQYGSVILLPRAITAIVLHLICGVVMGYFLAKAKSLKDPYINPESGFERLVNDYSKLGKVIYCCLGIFFATLLHGVYDYSLMLPFSVIYTDFTAYLILVFGLVIGFFIIKELIQLSREHRQNYLNGTTSSTDTKKVPSKD